MKCVSTDLEFWYRTTYAQNEEMSLAIMKRGWQDGPVRKAQAAKPGNLSSVPRNPHTVT